MNKYQVEVLDDELDPVDSMIFNADHKAHAIEQFLDAHPEHEEENCTIFQITKLK